MANELEITDGDNDSPEVKAAKNKVVNSLKSGKIKKPDKCDKCGAKTPLEAHHHKGYDEEHQLDVQWLCISCHKAADVKLRAEKKKKEEKDEAITTIQRYDYLGNFIDENSNSYMIESFHMTTEGYLTGRAIVTNIGVFPYLNADGSIHRELRLPEEVFKPESLESLKMKPISNLHPDEEITAENIKKHQVGFTGDVVREDNYHVSVSLTITDQETIQEIKAGKRGLSAGYSLALEEASGNYLGTQYDAIQREIKYNHIAIVPFGRAGDAARIRMDSNSAYYEKHEIKIEEDTMPNLKKIKLDGVDYEAEGEVIKTLNQKSTELNEIQSKVDTLNTDFTKLTAERDTLKDRVDQLEKELKELKDSELDETRINEAVEKRLKILSAADAAEIKVDEKDTELEIQKAVIIKVFPQAQLDNKDQIYIDARFDGAVELLQEKKNAGNRAAVNGSALPGNPDSDNMDDDNDDENLNADEARENYIKKIKKDSRSFTKNEGKE